MASAGIHHVTAIAGPAARNVDFYRRTLGLRLVKRTVNFDDPATWHLYFGDAAGAPGSLVTFFPWSHVAAGRFGSGETHETAFRVPQAAFGFWVGRLIEAGVKCEPAAERFGAKVMRFRDPDGMRLALVAVAGAEAEAGFATSDIDAAAAIRGLHSVTLGVDVVDPTAAILTDVFGFRALGREDGVLRHVAGDGGAGRIVDLVGVAGFGPGRLGGGSVHHVAFRAADDAAQAAMVARLAEVHGLATTEQKDRRYFRSVYFREPGGVLFEIATDDPGFAVDEPAAALGESLQLPDFLEPRRGEIAAMLPDLP